MRPTKKQIERAWAVYHTMDKPADQTEDEYRANVLTIAFAIARAEARGRKRGKK